jgi:twinkle protein
MISERHARGIEERGLSIELAADMGLYSARRLRDGSIEPDIDGTILALPYFEYDQEVNTNAAKTLYNANVLLQDDTMNRLEGGTDELIWTEGEFDCQAVLLSGYDTCVSVPDGAPPARDKNGKLIHVPDDDKDIDPEDDDKFAFMGRLMTRS